MDTDRLSEGASATSGLSISSFVNQDTDSGMSTTISESDKEHKCNSSDQVIMPRDGKGYDDNSTNMLKKGNNGDDCLVFSPKCGADEDKHKRRNSMPISKNGTACEGNHKSAAINPKNDGICSKQIDGKIVALISPSKFQREDGRVVMAWVSEDPDVPKGCYVYDKQSMEITLLPEDHDDTVNLREAIEEWVKVSHEDASSFAEAQSQMTTPKHAKANGVQDHQAEPHDKITQSGVDQAFKEDQHQSTARSRQFGASGNHASESSVKHHTKSSASDTNTSRSSEKGHINAKEITDAITSGVIRALKKSGTQIDGLPGQPQDSGNAQESCSNSKAGGNCCGDVSHKERRHKTCNAPQMSSGNAGPRLDQDKKSRRFKGKCNYCGKKGHKKQDCRMFKKAQGGNSGNGDSGCDDEDAPWYKIRDDPTKTTMERNGRTYKWCRKCQAWRFHDGGGHDAWAERQKNRQNLKFAEAAEAKGTRQDDVPYSDLE